MLSVSLVGNAQNKNQLNISGNTEMMFQYLNEDPDIGAQQPISKSLLNSYLNTFFTYGNFRGGLRFESYLPRIQGYPSNFNGTGLGMRYVAYGNDFIDVTVGSFYEQFGSGLSLRTYEDRALGYDNMLDGARVIVRPTKGVTIKGVYGKQRLAFNNNIVHANGIVRGVDGEMHVNSLFKKMQDSPFDLTLGGSFVSKFQRDNSSELILPQNTGAYGGRAKIAIKGFTLDGEYIFKGQDPSDDNGYIYNKGFATVINAGYSRKGLGILFSAKSVDNMSYRSDRTEQLQNVLINYLPALTKTHTYNLVSSLYPYATQPTGEVAFQGEVLYTAKKKSKLGGKYGLSINANFSTAYLPQRDSLANFVQDSTRVPYKTSPFAIGKTKLWQDFNINIYKKFSKKFNLRVSYYNMELNNDVATVAKESGMIRSQVLVVETGFKFKNRQSMRVELQGLMVNRRDENKKDIGFFRTGTPVDKGDWATILIEYTFNSHWFVSAMNQINFGNGNLSKTKKGKKLMIHHPYFSVGYIKGATRVTASYGRQRAGLFCVGGVCRVVPASNGLTLSITHSF